MPRWEVRSALRWGSQHEGYVTSQEKAVVWAKAEIKRHGDKGRIELIDRKQHIVYYDVFPEIC